MLIIQASENSVAEEVVVVQSATDMGTVDGIRVPSEKKWYPGKVLGKILDKKPAYSETPLCYARYWDDADPSDHHIIAATYGQTLDPPFLIPKPPALPASIKISIAGCTNLKSRLVRLIPRPINCYVCVSVAGITRQTPVIRDSSPDFRNSPEASFLFELPNSAEFREEGIIEIIIKDKHMLDEDVLSEVEIPLISLKTAADISDTTQLTIPLTLRGKKPRFGKGFKTSKISKIDDKTSVINLTVSKVDILQWYFTSLRNFL